MPPRKRVAKVEQESDEEEGDVYERDEQQERNAKRQNAGSQDNVEDDDGGEEEDEAMFGNDLNLDQLVAQMDDISGEKMLSEVMARASKYSKYSSAVEVVATCIKNAGTSLFDQTLRGSAVDDSAQTEIEEMLRAVFKVEHDFRHQIEALDGVRAVIGRTRGSELANIDWSAELKRGCEQSAMRHAGAEQQDMNARINEYHKELRAIKDAMGGAMGGEMEDEDADIAVVGVRHEDKCPLTGGSFENPVKNKPCGHHYSQAAIVKYVGSHSKKCPVSGCSHNVSKRTLARDPAFERILRQLKAKSKKTDDDRQDTAVDLSQFGS